jgi:hypothetical protein
MHDVVLHGIGCSLLLYGLEMSNAIGAERVWSTNLQASFSSKVQSGWLSGYRMMDSTICMARVL